MPSVPYYLDQAVYFFDLVEPGKEGIRNPTFRQTFAYERSFSSWQVIEFRAVNDLNGGLCWSSKQVARYHRSSVSFGRMKKLIRELNSRPLGDYFYKDRPHGVNDNVLLYHKRRCLHSFPMKVRRAKHPMEDRIVDYTLLTAPVSDRDLVRSERVLEQAVEKQNKLDQEKRQKDYYLSLRQEPLSVEERIRLSQILRGYKIEAGELREKMEPVTKQAISNKSLRTGRALRSISK